MLRAPLASCVVAVGASASAQAAATATTTFTSAGEHAFVVPAGVSRLQVTLVGGSGGAGAGSSGGAGGLPASASTTLSVSPGENLYAEVAGNGGGATAPDSALGGYGGGAGGGEVLTLFGLGPSGGGGGGASDIRTCSATAVPACPTLASRLVVAGGGAGGGGPGLSKTTPLAGGAGGAAEFPGSNGASDGSDAVGGGGGAATPGAGGAAGGGGGEVTGGTLGNGGEPGDSAFVGGAGGGGGGGLFGGGGGGAGAGHIVGGSEGFGSGGGGGGGGSSGVPTGAPGVSAFALLATAHGAEPEIAISWTMPPPASITGTPTAVTATSATLNGTVNPDESQLSDCHFTLSPSSAVGASVPCMQQLGVGEVPVAVSAQVAGLTPNTTYTVALSATSPQGMSTGAPVTFTTTAPPSPSPSASAGLSVGALKLSPTRFRRGRRAASIASTHRTPRRIATSTTISFTLSRAAIAKLTFEAPRPGVIVGRSCAAPSKKHRKGRRCTRYATVAGSVTLPAHAGADRISFDGVLERGKRLSPGVYRLRLRASSGTTLASASQRPTFTLLS